jgi:hypothetical protein
MALVGQPESSHQLFVGGERVKLLTRIVAQSDQPSYDPQT